MIQPQPNTPGRRASNQVALVAIGALVAAGLFAACIPGVTYSPSGARSAPPSTSTAPGRTTIASPEAAAALVVASDPRFAGLKAKDPNLIGQCCFWTATPTADGFDVTIEIGWGDCPAGCIDRHHWFYSVATDGTIQLDREDGPAVPAGIPGADSTTGAIGIRGIATGGPVCPVARPNDPACADRPVAGATVHVLDATGTEVATMETDTSGAFVVTLPPGQYRLVADPVQGLLGTPQPTDVTVGATQVTVQLTYDTGIR